MKKRIQLTPFNSNVQGDKKNSYRKFELSGVNYEEVLEQGDSVLVQDSESSSYAGFALRSVVQNCV